MTSFRSGFHSSAFAEAVTSPWRFSQRAWQVVSAVEQLGSSIASHYRAIKFYRKLFLSETSINIIFMTLSVRMGKAEAIIFVSQDNLLEAGTLSGNFSISTQPSQFAHLRPDNSETLEGDAAKWLKLVPNQLRVDLLDASRLRRRRELEAK